MDIFSALLFSVTFGAALSVTCWAVSLFVTVETAKGFGPGGFYYDCGLMCILLVGCSMFGVFDMITAGVIHWALGLGFALVVARIARALGLRKAPPPPAIPPTEKKGIIDAPFRVVS